MSLEIQTNTEIQREIQINKKVQRNAEKEEVQFVCSWNINTDNVTGRSADQRHLRPGSCTFFLAKKHSSHRPDFQHIFISRSVIKAFLCFGEIYSIPLNFEHTPLAAKNFKTWFVMEKCSRKSSTAR